MTDVLAQVHRTRICFNSKGLAWGQCNLGPSVGIRHDRLREQLAARWLDEFEGTFAEIEPEFDTFVCRFTRYEARDAVTGRYGRWLNPIGNWDWWELGGRFSGAIVGDPRPVTSKHMISSGPSSGRALMEAIGTMLDAPGPDENTQIEANVELVETLKERMKKVRNCRVPTAIVLPAGYCRDEDRWFDCVEWHDIRPGTRATLGVPPMPIFRR